MKHARQSYPISTTIDGREVTGTYRIEGGLIRVSHNGDSKATQLGGSAAFPEALARIMLRELAEGRV